MDNVQYEVRYIVFETLYWSVFENSYYKSETGETKHMIKIAIVEDEAMYAKQLQDFLRQYETENGEAFDITIYSDGDQIVHKYKSQFDIILMDVEMKFMDGMSAAEEIRKIDTEVVIIFITNMAQYAIRGYAVESQGHTLILHTILGDYETTGTMKEMEEKMQGMNFCRGNKGYLINLQHVDGIQDGCALIKGEQLVLSRARKKEFMEALTNYWGEVVK